MIPRQLQEPALRWMSERTMRYVAPAPGDDPLTRDILSQVRRDFFVGGPITVHALNPALMAGMWTAGRETVLVAGALDRAAKEAIAAGVSQSNRCPYCVDMHVSMTHAAGWHSVADAILRGAVDGASGERGRFAAWAMSSRDSTSAQVRQPPFTREALPEAIGTALFFHYINRVVNVLFHNRPLLLPGMLEWTRKWLVRMFGVMLRESVSRPAEPGSSLSLLPAAILPPDLAWAESNPLVAKALARWCGVVESAGASCLSETARTAVRRAISDWDGGDPPFGGWWIGDVLAKVGAAERPAAQLALLAALASYRVPPDVVAQVHSKHAGGEAVLAAVAWGSFTAARRIASWLAVAPLTPQGTWSESLDPDHGELEKRR